MSMFMNVKEKRLIQAVEDNNVDYIRQLISSRKSINLNYKNRLGYTPLLLAIDLGSREDIIKLLLDNNVNVNYKTKDNETALHLAISKYNLEIIQLLLENRVNINEQDKNGKTAIMRIIEQIKKYTIPNEILNESIIEFATASSVYSDDSNISDNVNDVETPNNVNHSKKAKEKITDDKIIEKLSKRKKFTNNDSLFNDVSLSSDFSCLENDESGSIEVSDNYLDDISISINKTNMNEVMNEIFNEKTNESYDTNEKHKSHSSTKANSLDSKYNASVKSNSTDSFNKKSNSYHYSSDKFNTKSKTYNSNLNNNPNSGLNSINENSVSNSNFGNKSDIIDSIFNDPEETTKTKDTNSRKTNSVDSDFTNYTAKLLSQLIESDENHSLCFSSLSLDQDKKECKKINKVKENKKETKKEMKNETKMETEATIETKKEMKNETKIETETIIETKKEKTLDNRSLLVEKSHLKMNNSTYAIKNTSIDSETLKNIPTPSINVFNITESNTEKVTENNNTITEKDVIITEKDQSNNSIQDVKSKYSKSSSPFHHLNVFNSSSKDFIPKFRHKLTLSKKRNNKKENKKNKKMNIKANTDVSIDSSTNTTSDININRKYSTTPDTDFDTSNNNSNSNLLFENNYNINISSTHTTKTAINFATPSSPITTTDATKYPTTETMSNTNTNNTSNNNTNTNRSEIDVNIKTDITITEVIDNKPSKMDNTITEVDVNNPTKNSNTTTFENYSREVNVIVVSDDEGMKPSKRNSNSSFSSSYSNSSYSYTYSSSPTISINDQQLNSDTASEFESLPLEPKITNRKMLYSKDFSNKSNVNLNDIDNISFTQSIIPYDSILDDSVYVNKMSNPYRPENFKTNGKGKLSRRSSAFPFPSVDRSRFPHPQYFKNPYGMNKMDARRMSGSLINEINLQKRHTLALMPPSISDYSNTRIESPVGLSENEKGGNRQQSKKYLAMLELLLWNDADPNIQDMEGRTSLIVACIHRLRQVVPILLEYGTSVNTRDYLGKTALMYSCEKQEDGIVKKLLEYHSNINFQDKNGLTALMLACKYDNEDIIKLLLENRARVNRQDKNGDTALTIASRYGCSQAIKLLLRYCANTDIKNKRSETALIIACRHVNENIIRILINHPIDMDIQDRNGNTALIYICQKKYEYTNLVQEFFKKQHINVNIKNKAGNSALHIAAFNNHQEIVKLLLLNHADINLKNSEGNTPLMWISSLPHREEIAQILLDFSSWYTIPKNVIKVLQLRKKNKLGMKQCEDLLLPKSYVDIDTVNNEGDSALMIACRNGHPRLVKTLLRHHANCNLQNHRLETAIVKTIKSMSKSSDPARIEKYEQIIKLLILYNADTHIKDNRKHDFVYYARTNKRFMQSMKIFSNNHKENS